MIVCEGYEVPAYLRYGDKYLTKTTPVRVLFVCEGYEVPAYLRYGDIYLTKTTPVRVLTFYAVYGRIAKRFVTGITVTPF
jgi:hypothetical protein